MAGLAGHRAPGVWLWLVSLSLACGFHTQYRPEESRHFEIGASRTFAAVEPSKRFDLSYADGTVLKGFNGVDVVRVGEIQGKAPFGLVYECNSPDFNGVDGILGFGLPKPGLEGRQLPRPLLWALTDPDNLDSNAKDLGRRFSFFSTDDTAELQLGGYDPHTCTEEMLYTPSLSSTDFIVGVTSVKYGETAEGAQELLRFTEPTGGEYLPAIMDSGTSCLVIPGDNLAGRLSNRPFDDFTAAWSRKKAFFITIADKQFTIPFSSWYLSRTNQTCVQPAPVGMQGMLIGDVFFRSYLVEFDMGSELRPVIGISPLNAAYAPVRASRLSAFRLHEAPVQKLRLLRGEETMFPAEHSARLSDVDQVPIFNKKGTQYFMELHIGTPEQPFTLIFDTGSAVFGVFTQRSQLPADIAQQLHGAAVFRVSADSVGSLMSLGGGGEGLGRGASQTLSPDGGGGGGRGFALRGQAVSMAIAGAELSQVGGGGWDLGWSGAAALAAVAGVAAMGVAVGARRRMARRRAERQHAHLLEGSYGSVCGVVGEAQAAA